MPRFMFVAVLIVACLYAPSIGARELYPQRVSVAEVRGDAGFYVVRLVDDRIFIVSPPISRVRKAPVLATGPATLTETALLSGGYTYTLVKR